MPVPDNGLAPDRYDAASARQQTTRMLTRQQHASSTLTMKGIFLTICARRAKETAMSRIHEVATITSKGQIPLPKPIRQALGVDYGGRVAFELRGSQVVVTRAEEQP